MSFGGHVFARVYDPLMSRTEAAGLAGHRRALLGEVKGSVLEIGAGTGANLSAYCDGVGRLTLTEPEPAMVKRLAQQVRDHPSHVLVLRAPAEDLPFDDDTFDVAVSTLVCCTVDDLPRALREVRRVLRAGAELRFIEHVRADTPGLARWQDRLNGVNRVLGHGCNCNRSTLDAIEQSGFRVTRVERARLRGAPPVS
jgi:ubiquinone/menaquinone biosynthesis C-methylase UbiE